MGFEVRGSRFEVRGSRFEVRGSRFEVRGSRFEVRGSRFEVADAPGVWEVAPPWVYTPDSLMRLRLRARIYGVV
jgi:hypothetical protein